MAIISNRIVVRIEITAISNAEGSLNEKKMDRLAMLLSDLHNSGKEILVVTSGAIALGTEKMGLKNQPEISTDKQVIAAIGQAELIKLYQKHFNEYNQIVAQVLLPGDIMENEKRVLHTVNTFNTLIDMGIIPVINENDAVSTEDIELDDNYPLALKVAKICNAGIIVIKLDNNGKFLIMGRHRKEHIIVDDESKLTKIVAEVCEEQNRSKIDAYDFPVTLTEINAR